MDLWLMWLTDPLVLENQSQSGSRPHFTLYCTLYPLLLACLPLALTPHIHPPNTQPPPTHPRTLQAGLVDVVSEQEVQHLQSEVTALGQAFFVEEQLKAVVAHTQVLQPAHST